MELKNRIKYRRQALNLSQKELGERIGYSPSSSNLYKIESGAKGLPLNKLCKLAEVLHTTPNWLLGWGGGDNVEISTPDEGSPMKSHTLDVYSSDSLSGAPVGSVYVDDAATLMATKATTDTLAPEVSTGDVIIIDKVGRIRNGAIVLAEIDGETDFRRVLTSDDITLLVADSQGVKPTPLTAQIKLLGTAVEIRKVVI